MGDWRLSRVEVGVNAALTRVGVASRLACYGLPSKYTTVGVASLVGVLLDASGDWLFEERDQPADAAVPDRYPMGTQPRSLVFDVPAPADMIVPAEAGKVASPTEDAGGVSKAANEGTPGVGGSDTGSAKPSGEEMGRGGEGGGYGSLRPGVGC